MGDKNQYFHFNNFLSLISFPNKILGNSTWYPPPVSKFILCVKQICKKRFLYVAVYDWQSCWSRSYWLCCSSIYQDLILKLDILRKLEKHRGCVNTVGFNAVGDILISGSDDKKVVLWDWETGQIKHAFHSGHHANVFQAKFMPDSGDSSIVTCAADGQVTVWLR